MAVLVILSQDCEDSDGECGVEAPGGRVSLPEMRRGSEASQKAIFHHTGPAAEEGVPGVSYKLE